MPCPDCGSPVRPDQEQLCPTCGYPLMFLRQPVEDDARSVPRSPNETVLDSTRQFPATTYGRPAEPAPDAPSYGSPSPPSQAACPSCGYPNDAARIRCERCGHELRTARPQQVVLGPAPVAAPNRRWLMILLVVLVILAVLSLLSVVVALFWEEITAAV
jgi:predicted amidophosphoribosyltransferase